MRCLATCQRSIFLCAMSVLGNVADAEEVVQESQLLMWKKFGEFQAGDEFSAWACQIARYQALKLRAERGTQAAFVRQRIPDHARYLQRRGIVGTTRSAAKGVCGVHQKLRAADRDLVIRRYRKGCRHATLPRRCIAAFRARAARCNGFGRHWRNASAGSSLREERE